ncbi:MAG: hypothetical protein AAFP02_22955, partial [Bacteroidota bacterium]
MAHRTEFNLTENIAAWKAELSRSADLTWDNVEELESHLLDEIDELKQTNLSEEECLLIAKNRIGSVPELIGEFQKVNQGVSFRRRVLPYLTGTLLFIAFSAGADLVNNLLILGGRQLGAEISSPQLFAIGLMGLPLLLIFILAPLRPEGKHHLKMFLNIPILSITILLFSLATIWTTILTTTPASVKN